MKEIIKSVASIVISFCASVAALLISWIFIFFVFPSPID